MLKQSECFSLVIKGIWVLSGIIDRKHPRHFSITGQVFSQSCLTLWGTEPRVSRADSSQIPDEGWCWGCLFHRPCVWQSHLSQTQKEMPAFRPQSCVECLSPQTPGWGP